MYCGKLYSYCCFHKKYSLFGKEKMKDNSPLVSVIVPAYNAEAYIDLTLDSILSQTYKNIEVLVIDDGSQDKTVEIAESFAKKDNRFILLKQPNGGVAAARNLGIEKSKGEYIAPIDADDIWYPEKIEKQVQRFLESDSSVGLVYTWSVFIDEDSSIIGNYNPTYYLNICSLEGHVYPYLAVLHFIGNASVPLFRRTCLDKVGGYNFKLKEENAGGCEDWDMALRIAEYYEFRVVPEFLCGYRQIHGSMSSNYNSMAKSHNLVIINARQQHPEIPTYIYRWSSSYFYMGLTWKCFGDSKYWASLGWLYKAIKLDFMLVFQATICKLLIKCILKIVAQPIISVIGIDYKFWPIFRKNSQSKPKNEKVVTTIAQLQEKMQISQEACLEPHYNTMLQRWLKIQLWCDSRAQIPY
jgi:glycosyltransferase involved in cell wall biosynthesis